MLPMIEKPHIFEIDIDVWEALSEEEITATVNAMKEFGIYKLPFDVGELVVRVRKQLGNGVMIAEARGLREGERFEEFYIVYPKVPKKALGWYKANPAKLACDNGEGDPIVDLGISVENKQIVHRFKLNHSDPENTRQFFVDGLVVLLASKGVERRDSKRGLAKLGIGKRRDEYTTTIRLARDLANHESVATGRSVRPHLRRGHIRSQHHGPQNSLVKRIWVEPCFVNADADFVSQRKAYRVIH